jgi:serine/threonine-protein kinase
VHAGDRLGPYILRREIGEGGIAAVFLAEHPEKKRDVVLKLLRDEYLAQPNIVSIFLGEPRALQAVEHENTLEVTDVVEDAARPYFATELLRGRTLAEQLKQGPMPVARALHIARQVATVLAHAHDVDVVHRNLKPANVFLVKKDGDADFVKLLELGATRMHTQGEKPVPGTVIGTPAYMAPEQLRQMAGDHRVDMYSFGVLLFELMVGRRPFIGDMNDVIRNHLLVIAPRAASLSEDVPDEIDNLIAQCLQKDPDKRPPSMHEVSLTLAAAADSLGEAPVVDEPVGRFIAVPKNTSGYAVVEAVDAIERPVVDATSAPPPILANEEEEPSFEGVTNERQAERSRSGDGEPVDEAKAAPPPAGTAAPAPAPARSPPEPEIDATLRPPPPKKSPVVPLLAAAGGVILLVIVIALARGGDDAPPPADPADVVDASQPEAPKPDEPKPDAPKPDAPKPDAPKPDAPKPAANGNASVRFTSTPAGAQVWIRMDKRIRMLCNTPCDFALPVGKEVLVELRLDGHKSAQQTITVGPGARVDGTLKPK